MVEQPKVMRLTLTDSVLVVHNPRLDGDTVRAQRPSYVLAVDTSAIRKAEVRKLAKGRTILVAIPVAYVVVVGLAVLLLVSSGAIIGP
jgi:hypothetical protein